MIIKDRGEEEDSVIRNFLEEFGEKVEITDEKEEEKENIDKQKEERIKKIEDKNEERDREED